MDIPLTTTGNISHLGQNYSFLTPILEQFQSSKKQIGIIHWWAIQPYVHKSDYEFLEFVQELEKFVNSLDVCIVISEEMFGTSDSGTWLRRETLYDMLDQYNTIYVSCSKESLMPKGDTFELPWFAKQSVVYTKKHIPVWKYYEPKQYTFNMLLGSEYGHRTYLFHSVDRSKVYTTYFGHPDLKSLSDTHLEDEKILDNLQKQEVHLKKLNTFNHLGLPVSHTIPSLIYDNSHFDIVTETSIRNGFFFATEKTAKPLATGRWFISYAAHKYFEYMEKWGFDFTDYQIDYDVLEETYRLDLIVKKIREISDDIDLVKQIYAETEPNRIHNKRIYDSLLESTYEDLTNFIASRI